MDKRVVFAVAGSGKTQCIIDKLVEGSRCLIVTYTDNNTSNLNKRVIDKFGYVPKGIRIYSYFTFLFSFCFRPLVTEGVRGINFKSPLPAHVQRSKKTIKKHYVDESGRLYANRIAKYFIEDGIVPRISERIEKYFDTVFIDEIQDFASSDFNFVCGLSGTNVNMLLVGDFYQHTFDTSFDGNIQKSLHDDYGKYTGKLKKAGFEIDTTSLVKSHRCSPNVCSYVRDNLGIGIESHRTDDVVVEFIEDKQRVQNIFHDNSIAKLFYQRSNQYQGNTDNWGNTKGLDDFQDICIALNPKTLNHYKKGQLDKLASRTKNKLYVACTRAKGNLYLVPEENLKEFKTK